MKIEQRKFGRLSVGAAVSRSIRHLCVTMSFLFILMLVSVGSLCFAKSNSAKSNTWIGDISDVKCGYRPNYPDHAVCARMCVRKSGEPYAIVLRDHRVLMLKAGQMGTNELNTRIADAIGQGAKRLKVTGRVDGDILTVDAIEPLKGSSKPKS